MAQDIIDELKETIRRQQSTIDGLGRLVAAAHGDSDLASWMTEVRQQRQSDIATDFDRGVDEGIRRSEAYVLFRSVNSDHNSELFWDLALDIGTLMLDDTNSYKSLLKIEQDIRAEYKKVS